MDLQKINVKFFVLPQRDVSLAPFIDIFNRWIQESEGKYYDLADYSHMHAGPGILLIAHEANISIDAAGERLGLLYNQKQALEGSNQEKLRFAFKRTLETCLKIEAESSLEGRFLFQGNEAQLCINDRLAAPNTEETFQTLAGELEVFARVLFAGSSYSIERCAQDPRQRFAVSCKARRAFHLPNLLENLN